MENQEQLENNNDSNTCIDDDKSLIEHLEELRKTLIKCFISVAVVIPFAFMISPKVLNLLIEIFVQGKKLYYFAPMEVFLIQLKLAFLMSLILCFPYISKQIWTFIVPALYENEKKFIKTIVISSAALFIFGTLFCLAIILPLIMNFALNFANNNVTAMFGVANVINLALNLAFVFGLMFQIPLITNLLIRWGILSYSSVSSKRRYVIIILLVFSALLTPPDIISQLLLFIPTYALFECGLILAKHSVESGEQTK